MMIRNSHIQFNLQIINLMACGFLWNVCVFFHFHFLEEYALTFDWENLECFIFYKSIQIKIEGIWG